MIYFEGEIQEERQCVDKSRGCNGINVTFQLDPFHANGHDEYVYKTMCDGCVAFETTES